MFSRVWPGRPYPLGATWACVIETAFTWGDDHPLRIPWHDTVVYETRSRQTIAKSLFALVGAHKG